MPKRQGSGKKPVPTEVLKLRGTYRADRQGGRVDDAVAKIEPNEIPLAPVSLDDYGQQIWYSVLQEYSKVKVFAKNLDLPMFQKYCWVMQEMNRIEQQLTAEGYLVAGNYGDVENPMFKIYMNLMNQAIKLSVQYGFTPAARMSLKLEAEKNHKDELSKFEEL